MKQTLQLRTAQHLTLTPQLQQSIRLLQLSTLELQQEIDQILQDNPLLERLDEPFELSARVLPDGGMLPVSPAQGEATGEAQDVTGESASVEVESALDWDFSAAPGAAQDDENEARPQLIDHAQTLNSHLMEQMRLTHLCLRDRALMTLLIGALDENGYLEESLEQILARIPEELEVSLADLSSILSLLQSFDPPGIAARSLGECLALQIRQLPKVAWVARRNALLIVEEHLTAFAQRDFARLKKLLKWDDDDLREVQNVIRRCAPHPGAAFRESDLEHVEPDVIVKPGKTGFRVELNPKLIPKLRINQHYADIIRQKKCSEGLSARVQEARWLLKNMRQRFDTILRVSEAIVARQKNFFIHGAIGMRPLVLREIADTLGLHESTISRVTTQKFMLTPHGMFELKYFFGSHVATETGGEASSTAIRALIKQMIDGEDPGSPLSDSKITESLAQQGMVIARRTVAKYREALKIPPVSLRKMF